MNNTPDDATGDTPMWKIFEMNDQIAEREAAQKLCETFPFLLYEMPAEYMNRMEKAFQAQKLAEAQIPAAKRFKYDLPFQTMLQETITLKNRMELNNITFADAISSVPEDNIYLRNIHSTESPKPSPPVNPEMIPIEYKDLFRTTPETPRRFITIKNDGDPYTWDEWSSRISLKDDLVTTNSELTDMLQHLKLKEISGTEELGGLYSGMGLMGDILIWLKNFLSRRNDLMPLREYAREVKRARSNQYYYNRIASVLLQDMNETENMVDDTPGDTPGEEVPETKTETTGLGRYKDELTGRRRNYSRNKSRRKEIDLTARVVLPTPAGARPFFDHLDYSSSGSFDAEYGDPDEYSEMGDVPEYMSVANNTPLFYLRKDAGDEYPGETVDMSRRAFIEGTVKFEQLDIRRNARVKYEEKQTLRNCLETEKARKFALEQRKKRDKNVQTILASQRYRSFYNHARAKYKNEYDLEGKWLQKLNPVISDWTAPDSNVKWMKRTKKNMEMISENFKLHKHKDAVVRKFYTDTRSEIKWARETGKMTEKGPVLTSISQAFDDILQADRMHDTLKAEKYRMKANRKKRHHRGDVTLEEYIARQAGLVEDQSRNRLMDSIDVAPLPLLVSKKGFLNRKDDKGMYTASTIAPILALLGRMRQETIDACVNIQNKWITAQPMDDFTGFLENDDVIGQEFGIMKKMGLFIDAEATKVCISYGEVELGVKNEIWQPENEKFEFMHNLLNVNDSFNNMKAKFSVYTAPGANRTQEENDRALVKNDINHTLHRVNEIIREVKWDGKLHTVQDILNDDNSKKIRNIIAHTAVEGQELTVQNIIDSTLSYSDQTSTLQRLLKLKWLFYQIRLLELKIFHNNHVFLHKDRITHCLKSAISMFELSIMSTRKHNFSCEQENSRIGRYAAKKTPTAAFLYPTNIDYQITHRDHLIQMRPVSQMNPYRSVMVKNLLSTIVEELGRAINASQNNRGGTNTGNDIDNGNGNDIDNDNDIDNGNDIDNSDDEDMEGVTPMDLGQAMLGAPSQSRSHLKSILTNKFFFDPEFQGTIRVLHSGRSLSAATKAVTSQDLRRALTECMDNDQFAIDSEVMNIAMHMVHYEPMNGVGENDFTFQVSNFVKIDEGVSNFKFLSMVAFDTRESQGEKLVDTEESDRKEPNDKYEEDKEDKEDEELVVEGVVIANPLRRQELYTIYFLLVDSIEVIDDAKEKQKALDQFMEKVVLIRSIAWNINSTREALEKKSFQFQPYQWQENETPIIMNTIVDMLTPVTGLAYDLFMHSKELFHSIRKPIRTGVDDGATVRHILFSAYRARDCAQQLQAALRDLVGENGLHTYAIADNEEEAWQIAITLNLFLIHLKKYITSFKKGKLLRAAKYLMNVQIRPSRSNEYMSVDDNFCIENSCEETVKMIYDSAIMFRNVEAGFPGLIKQILSITSKSQDELNMVEIVGSSVMMYQDDDDVPVPKKVWDNSGSLRLYRDGELVSGLNGEEEEDESENDETVYWAWYNSLDEVESDFKWEIGVPQPPIDPIDE